MKVEKVVIVTSSNQNHLLTFVCSITNMFRAMICTKRLVSIGSGDLESRILNSFCNNSAATVKVSILILVYNFPTMYKNVLLNLLFKSVVDISFSSNSSKSGVTS